MAFPDVSHKVLTQQLRELEADGVVERVDHGEIPPRVDYSLSVFGRCLAKCLQPLSEWGEAHAPRIEKLVSRRSRTRSSSRSLPDRKQSALPQSRSQKQRVPLEKAP
jgi:DNA-binding HxlR family transcriptional regulator